VTLNLWGGLQADVKLPMLILVSFLLGFVPMLIVHRARIWTMRRRLEALERQATAVAYTTPAAPPVTEPAAPVSVSETRPPDDRIATDNKVWPAP
jgi:hypothetical protein